MSSDADRAGIADGRNPPSETMEIRVPARAEYLPVVRAASDAVAGTNSLTYDEIVRLRAAVSVAFRRVMRRTRPHLALAGEDRLAVHFEVRPDDLQVRMTGQWVRSPRPRRKEEENGGPLLDSLVDRVERSAGPTGRHVVRWFKTIYSVRRAQRAPCA